MGKKGFGGGIKFTGGVKKGNLSFGVKTNLRVGGIKLSSAESTSIGRSGYKHTESSSQRVGNAYSNKDTRSETLNFNRHKTSESHDTKLKGISRTSTAQSRNATWTSVEEHKSRGERFAGIYAMDAQQTTKIGLTGYDNQWSTHERLGSLSTDQSHHVGFGKDGVAFSDKVSLSNGGHTLVGVAAPAVILGGTNPNLRQTETKRKLNNQKSSSSDHQPSSRAYSTSRQTHYTSHNTNRPVAQTDSEHTSCCIPDLGILSALRGLFGIKSEQAAVNEHHPIQAKIS